MSDSIVRMSVNIRILRKNKHLTQSELSDKCGVSREYIGQIERGDITNTTINTLKKICDALDVDLPSIL